MTEDRSRGRFAELAWHDLDGDPALLASISPPQPPLSLPSRLDAAGLLADSVALAVLAVHELAAPRRGEHPVRAAELPPVRLDGDRLRTSAQSERVFRLDGREPSAWAPFSGFFRSLDGWVRTHGNYPHHADRLRAILDLPASATPEDAARAIAGRRAQDLEDAAAEAGAILARVRHAHEWAGHPQARAVARLPFVGFRELAAARHPDSPAFGVRGSGGLPLAGLRVLDLTRVVAGPIATRDLAFAGADVLRIDSPALPEVPWQHLDTGQGKRSTLLDLGNRRDRAVFEELLAEADVLVGGYRPGSLDRFGLSPDEVQARRPGLVIGAVSAWGGAGPWRERRGFDSIVQAASGIAMIESEDGDRPGALPAQALDHSAGHLLAAGIVRALVRRRERGTGSEVSVALARIAQELVAAGATGEKSVDPGTVPQCQSGEAAGVPLVTAAPVLGYAGAPGSYPSIGGAWGVDAPSWLGRG